MPLDQTLDFLDKTFLKGDYLLKFVRDDADLKAVLNLRFNVFNLELNEGLSESYSTQLDQDSFDSICHHLMLIHKPSGKVIGTYRMQTQEMAQANLGWYSAGEFDFEAMPQEVLDESVELGRACIDREHRNLAVLYLLWRGIAWYLYAHNKKYFFGCASINSQDETEGQRAFAFIKKQGFLHKDILLTAKKEFTCSSSTLIEPNNNNFKIPKLFKTYIMYGSKVCSLPAIDRCFKTIDFMMIFDVKNLDTKTYEFFFEDFKGL